MAAPGAPNDFIINSRTNLNYPPGGPVDFFGPFFIKEK